LTACPTSVVCDDPSQLFLLTSGQELEDEGEFTGAMSTYEELILGYPDSPEAFTAAQRVKAIAFAGRVERSPEDIQALASAVIESESILPAYLKGVAECLRAWQGDRETAETNLEAQIASASHESDAAVAAKNLLELNTYSGTGGLAQLTTGNSRIRRDARQALFAFDSESFATHGESETSSRPGTLHVEPAYPNPFNPTTTVRLSLGTEAPLTVSIWNLAGQKVTVLHQGNLAAGEYEFQWNAEMHSSGVYLLRAETPGHAEQQKLLLIK
jgi:hypothetical protein